MTGEFGQKKNRINGKFVVAQTGNEYVSRYLKEFKYYDNCKRIYLNRRHEKRISAEQRIDKDITLRKLFVRDNGLCQICNRKCDWNDKNSTDKTIVCGDSYPSIDHIIPIALGGLHSWDNVQLLCRKCNYMKSDKLIYAPRG